MSQTTDTAATVVTHSLTNVLADLRADQIRQTLIVTYDIPEEVADQMILNLAGDTYDALSGMGCKVLDEHGLLDDEDEG